MAGEVAEEVEELDTNHITVVPGGAMAGLLQGAPGSPTGGGGGKGTADTMLDILKKSGLQKPKPKMVIEIRAFTKESLEKINLRTANLIRDYGFLPKRSPHIEDGAELPLKFHPFPPELLGKPVEELDQFVYEKVKINNSLQNYGL